MLDTVHSHSNGKLVDLRYKCFKVILNLFYSKCVRPVYGLDSTSNVIISLTSFPQRIDVVYITITTLLKQTFKPGKIMLWLAEEQFPNGEKKSAKAPIGSKEVWPRDSIL